MTQQENYVLTIKLNDSLYGWKPILLRHDKKLEVRIPPRTKDGTVIRLTNALSITDNIPGDIIVKIQVKPRPIINLAKGASIDDIFQFCLHEIGGDANDHVNNYLDSRTNAIYRQLFFEKAVGAIWVSGRGSKQCNTFLGKAAREGFPSTFSAFARWNDLQLDEFMKRMHPAGLTDRAVKKWTAVHGVAKWLVSFENECDFRHCVFRNALLGRNLDKQDISALRNQKLSFIGPANSAYIVRMLGAEEIKHDKWIKEFIAWTGLTFNQLEARVDNNRIPRGFFDVVIWEYCNMFVGEVSLLRSVLNHQFGFFVEFTKRGCNKSRGAEGEGFTKN